MEPRLGPFLQEPRSPPSLGGQFQPYFPRHFPGHSHSLLQGTSLKGFPVLLVFLHKSPAAVTRLQESALGVGHRHNIVYFSVSFREPWTTADKLSKYLLLDFKDNSSVPFTHLLCLSGRKRK